MAKEARDRNQPLLTDDEVEERRPTLLESIQQYNDGFFFESHETLEDLWLVTPFPTRDFFQAIIQLAAAFVHLMRHEYPGILRLLDASLDKLQSFPPDFMGVDVARLIEDARRARDELAALGPRRFEEWDRRRIPRIALLGDRSYTDGSE